MDDSKPIFDVTSRDAIGATRWSEVQVLDATGETTKALVSRPRAVAVLPVDDAGRRFALARQSRVGALGALVTEVPAGKVDDDEAVYDAARRELEEELGLFADWLEHVASDLLVSPGYTDERMDLIIASGIRLGENGAEAGIEPVWISIDELDATIHNVEDLKTYAVLQEFRYRLTSGIGIVTR